MILTGTTASPLASIILMFVSPPDLSSLIFRSYYTAFSALGVRRSGNPIGFAALHFVSEAVLMCSVG
jgi:hypothetical protein